MRIGLIPLDERPVNTRYPRMLAEIAACELVLPPDEMLSHYHQPADSAALLDWLAVEGAACDVLIVSCEMLGYGSLIHSRISHESVGSILARLEKLRELKARKPQQRIYGFSLITRISRFNDAAEEPAYWAEHGSNLYHFSQLLDQAQQGQPVRDELETLRRLLPVDAVNDFLGRRVRNHTVNLAALQLAADNIFDLLVLSSDDTNAYGLASREKRWLSEWAVHLNLDDKLLLYPGADEVGSVLVARAINEHHSRKPRFHIDYAVPGGEDITAAFEDSAVWMTIERQIKAVGGEMTAEAGDIELMVNPPRSFSLDWPTPYSETEMQERVPHLHAAVERLKEVSKSQRILAVADVAHANGADQYWMQLMVENDLLSSLDAYSAWNTAGNSIGTTVAQACIALHSGQESLAQHRFLAHRVIEDWLYQTIVRDQANQLPPKNSDDLALWIEDQLQPLITHLGIGFQIKKGSLHLPWNRTFEIDFDLETTFD